MFDIKSVNQRYFEVKLSVTNDIGEEIKNIVVQVEPPKLKVLKKITTISKAKKEDAIENLTDSIRMMLNKNKARLIVPEEFIDELDLDQMNELLTKYFEWLSNTKNSPN
ncbi:hypothetical protein FDA09_11815 [Clostridium botulinum]|uniref:hypothetical protein n=1 Tax=Clostridium botulinum TaxID=1491 RepID=UPI0007741770|nr:hypothetical protein [Clostridium botulinum]NFF80438.1 hypothetical protein [Clostridium botulinum]NFH80837.1 hypothetical protein [Clostridium botulinum]NFH83214.1 hypothetical protein [Clostridium botulinum]NFI12079.1 hypothetical protein [Clostridium botulinum]NFI15772.1 hypothetical protein [Clostridium botulinum]